MPRAQWQVAQLSSAGCALETVTVAQPITATINARNIVLVRFTLSLIYTRKGIYRTTLKTVGENPYRLGPDFYRRHIPLDPKT